MKKLNFYIAKQIIVGFLLVAFCLMSIIWLTQSLRFIELISNKGIALSVFIKMTSLLMPRIFTILSPISLFAAVLFVYNRMLVDRELSVIKAAGISPWENTKPALLIGLIMCLFNFYIINIGIPAAETAFKDLQWQVKNDVSQLMFREGEFTPIQSELTLFITSHQKDGSVGGVLINDDRNPKNRTTISAEFGRIIHTEKGPRILLINGSRQELNRTNNQFSSVSFDRYSVDFGAKESKARKAAGVREKTLSQLLNALDDKSLSPKDAKRWFVEGNKRFTTPLLNLVYVFLACTGLLVGNFNRRGQIKLISYSITTMVVVQAFDLSLGNLATKNLFWLFPMYLNLVIPSIICLWLLFFYRPNMFKKHQQPNQEGL